MYYLIIKWNDDHTTIMQFGVKCLADTLASKYAENHGDNINSINIKEV